MTHLHYENRFLQHGGSVPGYQTYLALFPDTKDGFIMFANLHTSYNSLTAIGRYMMDAVLGLSPSIDIDTVCKLNVPTPPMAPVAPRIKTFMMGRQAKCAVRKLLGIILDSWALEIAHLCSFLKCMSKT